MHPLLRGVPGDASQRHPSCFQLDDKQNIVRGQTSPGKYLGGEEVRACQNRHVGSDEVLPGSRLAAFRSRRDPMPCAERSRPSGQRSRGRGWQVHRRSGHSPSRNSRAPFAQSAPPLRRQSSAGRGMSDTSTHRTSALTSFLNQLRIVSGLAIRRLSPVPSAPASCRFRPAWSVAHSRAAAELVHCPEDPVLRDKIFDLKQQLLIDQPRHVGQ